jgi:hypothetical protein
MTSIQLARMLNVTIMDLQLTGTENPNIYLEQLNFPQ